MLLWKSKSKSERLADQSPPVDRRGFLATMLALPAAGRAVAQPADPLFLVDYAIAAFSDAEGWLLLADDDMAGKSDWKNGVLTYDFRQGASFVGIGYAHQTHVRPIDAATTSCPIPLNQRREAAFP